MATQKRFDECAIKGLGGLINLFDQRIKNAPSMDWDSYAQLEHEATRLFELVQSYQIKPGSKESTVDSESIDNWLINGLEGVLRIVEARFPDAPIKKAGSKLIAEIKSARK